MKSLKLSTLSAAIVIGSFTSFAQNTSPMIEVSGTSSMSIVPDRITVEIGIEEYFRRSAADDSVKVDLRSIESDVRGVLAGAGVSDSLITVTDIGNYSNSSLSSKFLMAKRLSAVLVNFSQLDMIAENLPDIGIRSFGISKLDNSDMARYNREGLKAALDAARSKAEFIAENERMGALVVWKVEETSPGYTIPQAFSNVAYAGGTGMDNMRRIERQYSVKVTYLLVEK